MKITVNHRYTRILQFVTLAAIAGCGGGGGEQSPVSEENNAISAAPPTFETSKIHVGYKGFDRIQIDENYLYMYNDSRQRLDRLSFDDETITTTFDNTTYADNYHDLLFATDSRLLANLNQYINRDFQILGDELYTLNYNFGAASRGWGINSFNKNDSVATIVGVASLYGGAGTITSITEYNDQLFWIGRSVESSNKKQLFSTPSHYIKSGDLQSPNVPVESILPELIFDNYVKVYTVNGSILIFDRSKGCFYSYKPETEQLSEIQCDALAYQGMEVFIVSNKIYTRKAVNNDIEVYSVSETDGQLNLIYTANESIIATHDTRMYYLSYANESWFMFQYDTVNDTSEMLFDLSPFLSNSNIVQPGSNYYHLTPFVSFDGDKLILLERQNQPEVGILKHVFNIADRSHQSTKDISSLIRDFHQDDIEAIDTQYLYLRYAENETSSYGSPLIFDLIAEAQIQPHSLYWAYGSDRSLSSLYMNIANNILYGAKGDKLYRIELDNFPSPMKLYYQESEPNREIEYEDFAVAESGFYWIEYGFEEDTGRKVRRSNIKWKARDDSEVNTIFESFGLIRDISMHDNSLFFLTFDDRNDVNVHKLVQIRLSDHTVVELATLPTIPDVVGRQFRTSDSMVFHGSKIFFPVYQSDNVSERIFSFDRNSQKLEQITETFNDSISDIATDGDYLYYTTFRYPAYVEGVSVNGGHSFVAYVPEYWNNCVSLEYREQDQSLYVSCGGELVKVKRVE